MGLSCRIEESILVSEIKKTSIFLLTIVTNESNLFRIELIFRWAKIINLFKFFRQKFLRIFCGFDIGCRGDVDVSFKLAKIPHR